MKRLEEIVKKVDEFKKAKNVSVVRCLIKEINKLYFLEVDNEPVVLKFSGRGWGEYEYKAMKTLYEEGYNVPKPYAFFPLHEVKDEEFSYGKLRRTVGWLVYSYIKGIVASNAFEKETILKATKFLKSFHDDPKHERERPFIEDYSKEEIRRGCVRLQVLAAYFSSKEVKKVKEFLKKYGNEVIDFKVIHGDYRPQNLIRTARGVAIIDFEGFSEGADPLKDLGIFLAEIDRLNSRKGKVVDLDEILKTYSIECNLRLRFHMVRRYLTIMKYDELWRIKAKNRIMKVINEEFP